MPMIFDKLSTYSYVSKYIQIDLRYSYIDIIEKFNKFCDDILSYIGIYVPKLKAITIFLAGFHVNKICRDT